MLHPVKMSTSECGKMKEAGTTSSHSESLGSELGKDSPQSCIFPLLSGPATLCQKFLHNFSWLSAQVTDFFFFFPLYAGTRFFEVE